MRSSCARKPGESCPNHSERPGHESGYFMREKRLIALVLLCVAVASALLISTRPISAQNHENGKVDLNEPPFPLYNPYPPGILPPDLSSEVARVLREIDVIEARAIERFGVLGKVSVSAGLHRPLYSLTTAVSGVQQGSEFRFG